MKTFIKYAMIGALASCLVSSFVGVLYKTGQLSPDVKVMRDNELVASAVCGIGYFATDEDQKGITKAEFKTLLAKSAKECEEPAGIELNHRHPDGDLHHAVLIGGETCVVNWELSRRAALKAFEDVCLNRNP